MRTDRASKPHVPAPQHTFLGYEHLARRWHRCYSSATGDDTLLLAKPRGFRQGSPCVVRLPGVQQMRGVASPPFRSHSEVPAPRFWASPHAPATSGGP